MKHLNQHSTRIFCALMEAMQGAQHLKINNSPFMPLTIEQIGTGIHTPWGEASLYSLCHYYEQNGDLMQDPEMCFIVADNRADDPAALENVTITPYSFQQANMGIYEESALIQNNTLAKFLRKKQADHAAFAELWLANISEQGFLE